VRCRLPNISGWLREKKFVYVTATSLMPGFCKKFRYRPRLKKFHCTYDPGKPGVVMLLMAVKSRGPYIGFLPTMPLDAEVRMYDRLFISPNPGKTKKVNPSWMI